MKRVFIVHGWEGSPQNCWFPWLKTELERRGFVAQVPAMPHQEAPTIEDWVGHLSTVVGESDKDTYFVGHSIGGQAILRYVQNLEKPVGGIVCVAGFFRLLHLTTNEEKEVAKPWLETPMNDENIKKQAGSIIAIFSDNDPDVDLGYKELFEERLGAKTIVEHNKGHFSDDAGIKELPPVLASLLEMVEEK
ncbi:MAG: serine hydrolase family protein [Parcubacteria group bacterium]|nr:serine hydrolase family protein [Parcubacteria group bacterium]